MNYTNSNSPEQYVPTPLATRAMTVDIACRIIVAAVSKMPPEITYIAQDSASDKLLNAALTGEVRIKEVESPAPMSNQQMEEDARRKLDALNN